MLVKVLYRGESLQQLYGESGQCRVVLVVDILGQHSDQIVAMTTFNTNMTHIIADTLESERSQISLSIDITLTVLCQSLLQR